MHARRPVDIHVSHQSRIYIFNFRYSLNDAISENLAKSVKREHYTLNQPDYINTLIAFDSMICAVTSNLRVCQFKSVRIKGT